MHDLTPAGALLVPETSLPVPATVVSCGDAAAWRYGKFFTANIRNPNTRRAYARACSRFFEWCEDRQLDLSAVRPFHIAAWVEHLQGTVSAPSTRQQLAALRMLCDWLVVGQVLPSNPAAAVRGPQYAPKVGRTPVLEAEEWRRLMAAIPQEKPRDLRDRALIAVLSYAFARIGAALALRVRDLEPHGAGWILRLREKGGKPHAMPCHHALAEALHGYISAAGIAEDREGWLFRSAKGRGDALSAGSMGQVDAWRMIRRRAAAAGILAPIGCHSIRATAITAYLANGGSLEHAQAMAAHESPRTTKLYDRTQERLTLEEAERVRF